MARFRDAKTGLPLASWNLWENSRGIHTFTCAAVVAGLRAAAKFAELFAEVKRSEAYTDAASEILLAMSDHLYSTENGRFMRSLSMDTDGKYVWDQIVDASLFSLFYFECFDARDPRVISTMEAIEKHLAVGGGIARFEDDDYMRADTSTVGNPWFICTLWLAEFYIATAECQADLARPLDILTWVAKAALPSGVLAEQLDPITGEHVSVSPLTWSHSTYVAAVHSFLKKNKILDAKE